MKKENLGILERFCESRLKNLWKLLGKLWWWVFLVCNLRKLSSQKLHANFILTVRFAYVFRLFFLFLEAWNCRFSFANSRIPFKMSARRFVRHFLVNSSLQNLKSSSNSSGILKLNTNFLRLVDFAWLRFWFCGGATFEPRNLAAHQWGIIFRDRRRTRRELRKRFLLQSQLKSERNWWKKCL